MKTMIYGRGLICLVITLTLFFGSHIADAATNSDGEEIIEECIIDKAKPADDPDNYMECNTDENKEDGSTDCCEIDGEKACCNKDEKWETIKVMAIGIGAATGGLMLILFLVLWCNPKTFPFMTRWKDGCVNRYRDWEDSLTCCQEHVQKKREAEAEKKRQAALPVYNTPDSLTMTVTDDFWGSP